MRSESLRVLGPHYYTLRSGSDVGGEVYERELLERLPALGVSVVLGLPSDDGGGLVPAGWRVDRLRHRLGLHWVAAPFVFTPWVLRALRRGEVDVLRGHSVRHTGPSLLLARSLARWVPRRFGSPARPGRIPGRVPVVIHHHHFFPRWAWLEAAILRRADAVITVSEFSRASLIRRGIRAERIHVVYDGVLRPAVTDGWSDAWPRVPGVRLLSLGRLEQRKRPDLAIETLAALQRSGVEASLVIAGEGPMLSQLVARVAARGIADRVRFVGRVSEEQKWRLYDSADVLLFGSTLEGFGLVVAEAQSRGVPVVAAAGTATSEVLDPGRTGLLASPDPEAFAASVASLAADGALRGQMSRAAAEFALRFDWDRCAAEVAGVYRSLVSPYHGGGREAA